MNNYERGSEWRKWDLHVHTPNSIYQKYGTDTTETWEKYIQDLESLPIEFSVLGINDYLFLDGYERLIKEQIENGRLAGRILLPVLEFRIEKFAGVDFGQYKRINLHVIFSNDSKVLSVETIKSQFLNTLEQHYMLEKNGTPWTRAITKNSVEELGKEIKSTVPAEELSKYESDIIEGFNNLNIKDDEIFKSLNKDCFKDKYLIALGKTEWSDFKWSDSSIATKKSIINRSHVVFTAAESIEMFYKSKNELTKRNVNDLLLDCSDAHSFSTETDKDRIGNCYTWIKADTTFDGLRQILNEHDRIFIGEKPLIHTRVQNNRTKYIKKIKIKPVTGYDGKYGKWFQNAEITLNHELIAIIGNKGSGKSAIADIIALCGNYKNQYDFSFLKSDRFRDGKHANNFEATLTWESEISNTKKLSNDEKEEIESVKYLPQGYFERLTNDFNSIQDFRKEIEDIVFTHLDEDSKIGFASFDDLIKKKKELVAREISHLKEKLDEINKSIFEKEKKLKISYKSSIEAQINKKNEELSALKEPFEIKNPNDEPEIAEKNKQINDKLAVIKTTISEIETQIKENSTKKREVLLEINELKEIKQKLKSKEAELQDFIASIKDELQKCNLNIEDILTYKFEYTKIDTILVQKEKFLKDYKIKLGEECSKEEECESLPVQLEKKKTELDEIQKTLGEAEKKYQTYLIEKKNWEINKNKIIGADEIPNTLKYLEKELKYITEILSNELTTEKSQRLAITKSIYEKMETILGIYRSIKTKIDSIISENSELLGQYKINIDASLSLKSDFKNKFLGYISLNKVGTYYGKENAEAQVNELIKNIDFDSVNKVNSLLNNIIDSFFKDKRNDIKDKGNDKKVFIENQVEDVIGLYNYLFSLDFLDYNYELKQGEKTLERLSPGEKGALLLIFYLLLDNNDVPLIIDQPEDNLDNHSVANILVPFIKKAKAKRQIILVTHNPNLAVVADAEQVIYVELDKENDNTFDFKSGSIENPIINECIVKVLEGDMPAFNKRKQKYLLNESNT